MRFQLTLLLLCNLSAHASTLISENFDVPAGNAYYNAATLSALTARGWTIRDLQYNQPGVYKVEIISSPTHSGSGALRMVYDTASASDIAYADGDCCNGGLSQYFAPQDEIWERFYLRFDPINAGSQSGVGIMKVHYYNDGMSMTPTDGSGGVAEVTGFAFTNSTSEDIQASGNLQTGLTMVCPSGNLNPSCNLPSNVSFNDIANHIGNGHWYCIEGHFKLDPAGAPNTGVVVIFVDGVQTVNYTNINWRTNTANKFGRTFLYRQAGGLNLYRYEDDYVLATTRIGCGTAPSDTTPPVTPNGLRVS